MYCYRSNYDGYNKLFGSASASYNSDVTHNAIYECYIYYYVYVILVVVLYPRI